MSKMSQIAMELDEQAVELGFESREEALAKGYDVCYGEEGAYLYEKKPEDEQLLAHKEWLKEKASLLKDLNNLQETLETLADGEKHEISSYWADTIWHAIKFIEKGEM